MGTLHGDLVLLAAVAQAYGRGEPSQQLYALAQYSTDSKPRLSSADMWVGLKLCGLEGDRYVAGGETIPQLISHAVDQGHVVLAQVVHRSELTVYRWCALCTVERRNWTGIAIGEMWAEHSIASSLGWASTGHYLIVADPLPGWDGSDTN